MSDNVHFAISAKTARLIGRENIPSLEGALIELVKNSYDADASCSVVLCNVPFPQLPPVEFDAKEIDNNPELITAVEKYYSLHCGVYSRLADVPPEDASFISSFFAKKNYIAVIDNGSGMSKETVNSVWMTIGTNDKEKNPKSNKKNRIKTGAKGIGRFAVDRLSTSTKMITRHSDSKAVIWSIDWNQFDGASMLSDIAASEMESDDLFENLVADELGISLKSLGEECTDWTCGTCLFLSPLREIPDSRQMDKITRSLRNINPMQNSDRFSIFLYQDGDCILKPENTAIERSMFDYHVIATYDGDNKIVIQLDRNEIDIDKLFVQDEVATREIVSFPLEEFWSSPAFSSENYSRESYASTITTEYDVESFFTLPTLSKKHPNADDFRRMGKVKFDFYFVKNTSSPEGEIIKPIQPRIRKNILYDFVGVKIFRDNFRIRPYGEQGTFEDWIGIGIRHGKSPAAASHSSGYWRISTNQIIGSVDIGRDSNPFLVDNANREGLAPGSAFDCLIDYLQEVLAQFEFDRQYPLREYAKWIRKKKEPYESIAIEILDRVRRRMNDSDNTDSDGEEGIRISNDHREYSSLDYENAINVVVEELDSREYLHSLILSLCTAGMLSNTFVHEAKAIETHISNRWDNLNLLIDKMMGNKPYEGDPDYSPYDFIELQKPDDDTLASWISLVLDTTKRNDGFVDGRLKETIITLINDWYALLEKKKIELEYHVDDDLDYKIKLIDLAIIINNFILNSAWFLEKQAGRTRNISIRVNKDSHYGLIMHLENNGPPLDEQYVNNPNVIFDAGVSSKVLINDETGEKTQGSGLGLWFMKTIVESYNGSITVSKLKDGFGLDVFLP